jgi:hypothetical protein
MIWFALGVVVGLIVGFMLALFVRVSKDDKPPANVDPPRLPRRTMWD